jgi:predicted GNAT family N-acyltransferase
VEKYLKKQDNLYISFDESNDIANNRIINISITTERDAFYNKNINLGAIIVSAEFRTEKIKQQALLCCAQQTGKCHWLWKHCLLDATNLAETSDYIDNINLGNP